jgi:hypothetical protein
MACESLTLPPRRTVIVDAPTKNRSLPKDKGGRMLAKRSASLSRSFFVAQAEGTTAISYGLAYHAFVNFD